MKEIIAFMLGGFVILALIKATGTIVHIGTQDLVCYVIHNPLN